MEDFHGDFVFMVEKDFMNSSSDKVPMEEV